MPRFTLHGAWLSGPTYKVGLMLSLCGEPFGYRHVDLRSGAHKQPDHLAVNRYGQVPALQDGDLALCQSGAILEYLAEVLGKFQGRDLYERARAREWLFWDFDRLAPGIYRSRAIARGFFQAAEPVAAMFRGIGDAGLQVLEDALRTDAWLVGNGPTIADIDIYGVVHFAPDAGFDLTAYPSIAAWMGRVEALSGFGAPEDILPKESREQVAAAAR